MKTPRRLFAVLAIMFVLMASAALADHKPTHGGTGASVGLIPATGGSAISSATVGGAYTTLTGPLLSETGSADIENGTLILNAPSGFQFNPAAVVTVLVIRTGGNGADNKNINNVANGTALTATVTTSQINFTITDMSDGNVKNNLTFQNIQVRPTAVTSTSGNIVNTGSSVITGRNSTTNYGTLTEILAADTTAPIITLLGSTPINVTQGNPYIDAGATATDNIDGNITANLTNSTTVNTATLGNYTFTYFVADAAGNTANATRIVQVVPVPNAAPVVSSVPLQTVAEGTSLSATFATFTDANAGDTHTATIFWDDNTLSAGVVSETAGNGSVNGSHTYKDNALYVVLVRVFDSTLNRTNSSLVQVTNVAPIVTNAGVNRSITNGTVISLDPATFTDAGAGDNHTATINWGDGSPTGAGNVTETAGSGTVQGSHNYTTVGVFTVTVLVKDDDNANSTGTFKVNVSAIIIPDTTPPTITLNGSANVVVSVGTNYTDAGATATDAVDGSLTVNITKTGFVNTSLVGNYSITYKVRDAAGNNATPIVRTVQVVDTGAPTITILGTNPISISGGTNYSDAGATAWDNVDGSLNVTTTGSVDTSITGTYVITYRATDSANNTATANRTVNVNTVPIIIIIDNGNGQSSVVTIPGNDLSGLNHNLFHELADGLEGFQGPQSSSGSSIAETNFEEILADNEVPSNGITGAVVGAGNDDNNWYGLLALILGALGALGFVYRKQ